ncbi:hypothetical protein HELRODRAFT_179599 [Helobdella robusta]|uniref:Uncharacterized protein n=1 Tax=Helobdella robusta TaxID=6412 RepID=T1FEX5_HELRO|nr:hypothetical protein HELRODRAFT_179599 [Helobdella robusta]ESN95261.1 hypothetical protein HELRODRAFT_179599 [Helobdella robusta]
MQQIGQSDSSDGKSACRVMLPFLTICSADDLVQIRRKCNVIVGSCGCCNVLILKKAISKVAIVGTSISSTKSCVYCQCKMLSCIYKFWSHFSIPVYEEKIFRLWCLRVIIVILGVAEEVASSGKIIGADGRGCVFLNIKTSN